MTSAPGAADVGHARPRSYERPWLCQGLKELSAGVPAAIRVPRPRHRPVSRATPRSSMAGSPAIMEVLGGGLVGSREGGPGQG